MKYLCGSHRGKWEIFEHLEDAVKICDKKNKTNKNKWFVVEMPEDEVEYFNEHNAFHPCNVKVVYDPFKRR